MHTHTPHTHPPTHTTPTHTPHLHTHQQTHTDEPELAIRLVNGVNESEGRVEILYNNTWGTICDNTWDLNDARVVCRHLGFSGALRAPRGAAFPSADPSAPVWLDQIHCTGLEEGLDECPHGGYGGHLCTGGHSEDAGVVCRGMRSTCVCLSVCPASKVSVFSFHPQFNPQLSHVSPLKTFSSKNSTILVPTRPGNKARTVLATCRG